MAQAPDVMAALRAGAAVNPPQWLVDAGAIRNTVWDLLHDREPEPQRDIDFAFFDAGDVTPECDDAVEAALLALEPGLPWHVANQAAVHIWYPRRFGFSVPPFASCEEALTTFPEVASCVGVRLVDDQLEVVAPFGLDDLFGMVVRWNPTRVSREFFDERVASKGWRERWPRLVFADAR